MIDPRSDSALRVATMNIFGRQGNWDDRRRVLVSGFHALRPDIVAFQEAIVFDGYDQVRDVLGDEYHVFHQAGRAPDGSGASIASIWPIASVDEHPLHVSDRLNPEHGWIGSVAIASIACPPAWGRLAFVQFKPSWQLGYERERELQAVAAGRLIESEVAPKATHVVMAGDFDATPHAASVRFWSGRQSLDDTSVSWRDAWDDQHPDESGETFTNANPLVANGDMPLDRGRRIDYIFLRCHDHGPTLKIERCERLFDQPVEGVWASDHYGLVADFVLPG